MCFRQRHSIFCLWWSSVSVWNTRGPRIPWENSQDCGSWWTFHWHQKQARCHPPFRYNVIEHVFVFQGDQVVIRPILVICSWNARTDTQSKWKTENRKPTVIREILYLKKASRSLYLTLGNMNTTYLFFKEGPGEFQCFFPTIGNYEMLGSRPIFACNFLDAFNVFDSETEVMIKFGMEGQWDELELSFRCL